MNLLLLDAAELDDERRIRLDDRRAEHLVKVLGVEPGRVLRAGIVGGAMGAARVTSVVDGAVELEVDVPAVRVSRPTIDLVVALPRPPALRRLLQIVATMGVGRLHLTNAWRVEKSYFASPALEPGAIRRQLLLGAEQGKTTWLPEVRIHRLLVPFLEEHVRQPELPRRLLAHPTGRLIETAFEEPSEAPLEIAIGPEGGWIDREVETFRGLGFEPVSLGPWTLRVETAVVAALAQIGLLRRRL